MEDPFKVDDLRVPSFWGLPPNGIINHLQMGEFSKYKSKYVLNFAVLEYRRVPVDFDPPSTSQNQVIWVSFWDYRSRGWKD